VDFILLNLLYHCIRYRIRVSYEEEQKIAEEEDMYVLICVAQPNSAEKE
jgi:hypothetical protein